MSWSLVETRRYAMVFGVFLAIFDENVMGTIYLTRKVINISMVFVEEKGKKIYGRFHYSNLLAYY